MGYFALVLSSLLTIAVYSLSSAETAPTPLTCLCTPSKSSCYIPGAVVPFPWRVIRRWRVRALFSWFRPAHHLHIRHCIGVALLPDGPVSPSRTDIKKQVCMCDL